MHIRKLKPADKLIELVNELLRRAQRLNKTLRWSSHAVVLRRLAQVHEQVQGEELRDSIKAVILDAIETSEDELRSGKHGIGPGRVEALEAYIYANLRLAKLGKRLPTIDDNIILPHLYQMCWEVDVFTDGSVYHSLQVTTYSARCIVTLLLGRWKKLDELVLKIYKDALRETLVEEQESKIRQEIFDGLRRENQLSQQLQGISRQNKTLKTFIVFLLSLIISAPLIFLIMPWLKDDLQSRLSLIGTVVGAAIAIDSLIFTFLWKSPEK